MTSWRSRLYLTLRLAMGAVFLYAAWTKLTEPWSLFAMAVDAYGVLPQWAVVPVARTLPWAEAAIGALLVAGWWTRPASVAACTLLLGFLALMVRAYLAGMQIECGCFGAGDAISLRTLARDGALFGGSVALVRAAFTR